MSTAPIGPAELADMTGQEIGVSSWIEVGQRRIDEFAHCTEDRQWIHVDVERAARESPAGGTIAHGYLTLALLAPTGMEILVPRVRAKQILNYGLDKVRFLAPVLAGKRVRNRIKLAAAEDKGGGRWLLSLVIGQVRSPSAMRSAASRPCCTGRTMERGTVQASKAPIATATRVATPSSTWLPRARVLVSRWLSASCVAMVLRRSSSAPRYLSARGRRSVSTMAGTLGSPPRCSSRISFSLSL